MLEYELKTACSQTYEKYLAVEKAKLLDNTLIDNQFNSAPLIWMFCHKTLYLKIEKIHYKTLRIIHQSNFSYRDLIDAMVVLLFTNNICSFY